MKIKSITQGQISNGSTSRPRMVEEVHPSKIDQQEKTTFELKKGNLDTAGHWMIQLRNTHRKQK